jgi:DNA polymerase-3 subunit gamma/tau
MSAPIPISAAVPQLIPETRGANAVSLAASAESTPAPRPAIEIAPSPGAPFMPESHPGMGGVPTPTPEPTTPGLQHAIVEALNAASQTSAAEALADAAWVLAEGVALIQTTLSKTMLPVVLNPDAEKIVRAVLRDAGILKLTLLPAVAAPAAAKKPRPARTGSIHAKALEHPMVQQAQKLFAAEVQTVIDLREPD